MTELAEKIKKLRKDRKMAQAELAKELGVSNRTISNYETGKSVPSGEILEKLSEVLGEKQSEAVQVNAPAAEKKKMTVEEAAAKLKENEKAAAVIDTFKQKIEEKIEETKAEEKKAEEKKAEEKKATEKKAGEKKPAAKKTQESGADCALTVTVQSMSGGSITVEEITAKVKAAAPDAMQIYVKPEENKAYWVSAKSAGAVNLWD